jgi:hypothetical protein
VRQSVIGEPPNLIQNVTAKRAEIGRCMPDIVNGDRYLGLLTQKLQRGSGR